MFTKAFWQATFERFVKTFAQVAGATLIASGTGLIDTDWVGVLSTVGMASVLSVLTSIGSAEFLPGDGPAAFGPEELNDAA